MGRKNRNKKNKKKKEGDGSTGNVNGGSNNDNNVATTTTVVLTQRDLKHIDNILKLKGYPKSHSFKVGYKHQVGGRTDSAIDAFKRGATEVSCVPSMVGYAELQRERGNVHLAVPFYIEAAIQGHTGSMGRLTGLYEQSKPRVASALASEWVKTKIEFGDSTFTEESWKEVKKNDAKICVVCGKEESEDNDVTLVRCGICKFYSYCGKKCQTHHWKTGHSNECRQVILLRKYCQPSYVKEIREAIIGGQDPKEIHTLQRLRMNLGLNRPKEKYEELVVSLNDNNNTTRQDPYEYLVGRKDGTVWIGSTPEAI